MKCHILCRTAILLWLVVFSQPCRAATITWTNIHPEGPALATDRWSEPLRGTTDLGPEPDLSLGALVQLWKAVGHIDDPMAVVAAYESTSWSVNDVLLDESHIGYGTSTHPNGSWSDTGDYAVNQGDILYARVYNLPKQEWNAGSLVDRELGIRNRGEGEIVFQTAGDIGNPQTLYFDHLHTGWSYVPEPSAVLLVIPGVVVWAMRKRH